MPGATKGAVAVQPDDFILADADGAIVIPGPLVEDVLERAEKMVKREQLIRERLAGGLSLAAALAEFGHV